MSARFAQRLDHISPFHVMRILEEAQNLARQGRDVLHLEVGEPDFPTPAPIIAAGQQALAEGKTFYTPACGIPELRQAISDFYQTQFGARVSPERIIVTPGASGALQLALAVLVNPGDQVLMADPTYPCNKHFVSLLEGVPVSIGTTEQDRLQLQPHHIATHWTENTVAAMVATPANPTGTMLTPGELRELIFAVAQKSGRLIVDEIYQGLTYTQPAFTAASLSEDIFVINSFSKFFQMTGWRLGWLIAPEAYVPQLEKLAQNLFLAAPTLSQYAALAAFKPETLAILEERRQILNERRLGLADALESIGFRFPAPADGAFYLYADCTQVCDSSSRFAQSLLQQEYVATTPGTDFAQHRADQFLRFAYTMPLPRLIEAVERMQRHLKNRNNSPV